MAQKRFHRHFETPGLPLYWIIIAYIILAWFFPVIGLLALICMIGPVVTSIYKGRWWCGHVCPRGNMYDRLLSKYSPHRPIPKFVRTFGFRLFMVFFIFGMFGIMHHAHGVRSARWEPSLTGLHQNTHHCPKHSQISMCRVPVRCDASSAPASVRCNSRPTTLAVRKSVICIPTV